MKKLSANYWLLILVAAGMVAGLLLSLVWGNAFALGIVGGLVGLFGGSIVRRNILEEERRQRKYHNQP